MAENKKITIKDILERWLTGNGYDGLCCDDCGCFINDLIPCDGDFRECKPGYKVITKWEVHLEKPE